MEIKGVQVRSKYDYRKYERSDVHTTIRKDLYKEWKKYGIDINQPLSKMNDVIINLVLSDEEVSKKFHMYLNNYR